MLSFGFILVKYKRALLNGATLKLRSKLTPEHCIVSFEDVMAVKSFSIKKDRYLTASS